VKVPAFVLMQEMKMGRGLKQIKDCSALGRFSFRRLIQPPIVEHCLHVALDVGLNPGHRRVPVKILAKIGCVHRGQPRWWLFNLVVAHYGSAIGGADFQGPALAHSGMGDSSLGCRWATPSGFHVGGSRPPSLEANSHPVWAETIAHAKPG
jgi:hypothetical protein